MARTPSTRWRTSGPGQPADWQLRGANGDKRRTACQEATKVINAAGGKGTFLLLPEAGIAGNSHMMMMDKNNLQVADLPLKWLGEHLGAP